MKTLLLLSCLAAFVVSLNACSSTAVDPADTDATARTAGVLSTSLTGPHKLTVVAAASLPAAITTYITTTYAGATVKEALKDAQGNYIVAITVNGSGKLLLFNADGTFVKEADGMPHHVPGDSARNHVPSDSAKHHMPGDSSHHPKPAMGDSTHHPRPGQGPNVSVVAVSSLPAAITTYIATNYTGATIKEAIQEKTSGDYIIALTTTDGKRVLLVFGSDGTFKKAKIGK